MIRRPSERMLELIRLIGKWKLIVFFQFELRARGFIRTKESYALTATFPNNTRVSVRSGRKPSPGSTSNGPATVNRSPDVERTPPRVRNRNEKATTKLDRTATSASPPAPISAGVKGGGGQGRRRNGYALIISLMKSRKPDVSRGKWLNRICIGGFYCTWMP